MAGLAALLSFGSDRTTTQTLEALSKALEPRGADATAARCGAARLLIRAALPKVHEADGTTVIVDGLAETSILIARHTALGPTGLLHGQHPYALILADQDGIVLARHLDGPPLYYARTPGAVVIASEPAALVSAGIPATPNPQVVERFLASGACDDVPATFFDAIRRVLPGQVVEVGRHTDGWSIRAHPCAVMPRSVGSAQARGVGQPVPPLPMPRGEIDVDGFLSDLGEPVPRLADYALWATARAAGGEIDLLPANGSGGYLSRLADRIATRYGVALRPAQPWPSVPLAEVLQRIRPAIAEALLYPRYGHTDYAALATLSSPRSAQPLELEQIWRLYLVQRWARAHAGEPKPLPTPRVSPTPVRGWQRHPLTTEGATPGVAWHVSEFVNGADKPARQALRQPWLLIVPARAVTIGRGEARPIWDIAPGRLARALVRFGGRIGHTDPWTMQVAIELSGRLKLCAALLFPMRYRESARCLHCPTESAGPPASVSVVGPPRQPARAAAEIANELRRTLPGEIFATLRGCAIVGGGRVLGWSGPPPAPAELLARLAEDAHHTMIALAAPAQAGRKTSRKPAKRR